MILTEDQKHLLLKYDIPFKEKYNNLEELDELMLEIDAEMTVHVDKYDEPLKDFYILQDLYDEIFYSAKFEDA